jgi:hypothetical protein
MLKTVSSVVRLLIDAEIVATAADIVFNACDVIFVELR